MEELVGIVLWSTIIGLCFYCVYDAIKERNKHK